MLYRYSLSETFREFVLLKCWVFTLLYPTEIPNACLILEKHVRVLFEGKYSVNCMASRSPPRQFNWVDFIPLTGWRLFSEFFPPPAWLMLRFFVFLLWETQKHSPASFLFSSLFFSVFSLSPSAVFCEQTITCWRNNKSLLGKRYDFMGILFSIDQFDVSEIQVLLIIDVNVRKLYIR